MTMLMINTESEKEKHISWFTIDKGNEIDLMEVVEVYYKHPQAPESAYIQQIETKFRRSYNRVNRYQSSHVVLLESILNTVSKLEKDKKG